jgi:hypothetical protein
MKPTFNYNHVYRARTGFHSSDFGRLEADIMLDLQGVKPTNPMKWNDTLRLGAGKGVELAMINILKENLIVAPTFNQDECPAIVREKDGIVITSHLDAEVKAGEQIKLTMEGLTLPQSEVILLNPGEPIEIKSINNKNSVDIQKYISNKPRETYVGQLADYMEAKQMARGHLFVASVDGLHVFWFVCEKVSEGVYKCGETQVDLGAEHKRWAGIWARKEEEPNWFEETYKLPLEEIDWTKLSTSKIGDVRNGRFVVGSEGKWRIDYSPYKDLIIQKQGVVPGYSDEDLEIIRTKTAGYSSKKGKEPVSTE